MMKLKTFGFLSLLRFAAAQIINCSTDIDCPSGQICEFNEIWDGSLCFDGCRADAECPSGWECDKEYNECEVPYASCSTDSDCGSFEGTVCLTKWNRTFCASGCRSDSDCPSGHLCNDTDPEWPKCDKDFCREDVDCGKNEMCIETSWSSSFGKTCVENGCRSDTDCYKDEACVEKWGSHTCRSREDCASKGCDQGRLCVTVNAFFDVHQCEPCEDQEKWCDVEAVLNTVLKPFLDIGTHADTDEPLSEEDKQRTMDHYRENSGVHATVESCQSMCKGSAAGRTPNPVASPTPAPTPSPTPSPSPAPTPSPTPSPYFQKGGDGFLEFGKWRVGVTRDGEHFTFCHADTFKTAVAFKRDGTMRAGPNLPADLCLWAYRDYANSAKTPINVLYGEDWIQFGGKWRLGATDDYHASIAYQDGSVENGATAMIWRYDGRRFGGPRRDYSTWKSPNAMTVKSNIAYGDKYIQFGHFRMGEIDDTHMSIWRLRTDKTAVIYRADGTIHPGKGRRTDFNHEKPVMGQLRSWNNFEGHATFDKPRLCDTVNYHTKCTACPAHWYSSCAVSTHKNGWEGCGFMGCRLTCKAKYYDYGCGCAKKPYNLNGLKICKTSG